MESDLVMAEVKKKNMFLNNYWPFLVTDVAVVAFRVTVWGHEGRGYHGR